MSESRSEENKLTPEAKAIIRDFVWKTLAVPGVAVVIISAVAGYAFDSLVETQIKVAHSDATRAAYHDLFEGAKYIEKLRIEYENQRELAAGFVDENKKLNEKLNQSVGLLESQSSLEKIKQLIQNDSTFVADLAGKSSSSIKDIQQRLELLGQKPAAARGSTGSGNSPPNSGYQEAVCPNGEYLAGIKGWGAHGGVRYCVGCFVAVDIICKPF